MDKKVLRKRLITIRENVSNKREKSIIIMNKIIKLNIFQSAEIIALYKSLLHEVDTEQLINYAQKCGKKVLLPRVVGDNLDFFIYQKDDILEESNFHVLEPIYNENNIYNDRIDLIIVPGVGFDKYNNRLGYGKGYYDRFLKESNSFKIGICFKEQLIDKLPIDKNDVKMDMIISN